jgi:hypothetical protein
VNYGRSWIATYTFAMRAGSPEAQNSFRCRVVAPNRKRSFYIRELTAATTWLQLPRRRFRQPVRRRRIGKIRTAGICVGPDMAVPGGEKVPLTPGPLFPRPSGDHPGPPLPLSRYEMAVREALFNNEDHENNSTEAGILIAGSTLRHI